MSRTLTLKSINEEDSLKVGYNAFDLAKIFQKSYLIPYSFVIPTTILEKFLEQTGLKSKIDYIYQNKGKEEEDLKQAYMEIKELFERIDFPEAIEEELIESYESIATINDSSAQSLMSTKKKPLVLFPSVTYIEKTNEGILQNISGEKEFLKSIKKCWGTLFSPKRVIHRQKNNIINKKMGIIVMQQKKTIFSAQGTINKEKNPSIKIETYQGIIDFKGNITKNEYLIDDEHLLIINKEIKKQEHRYITGENSGEIEEVLANNKLDTLNERDILEIARLTKRIQIILNKNVSVTFSIKDQEINIINIRRLNNKEINTTQNNTLEKNSEIKKDEAPLEKNNEEKNTPINEETKDVQDDVEKTKTDVLIDNNNNIERTKTRVETNSEINKEENKENNLNETTNRIFNNLTFNENIEEKDKEISELEYDDINSKEIGLKESNDSDLEETVALDLGNNGALDLGDNIGLDLEETADFDLGNNNNNNNDNNNNDDNDDNDNNDDNINLEIEQINDEEKNENQIEEKRETETETDNTDNGTLFDKFLDSKKETPAESPEEKSLEEERGREFVRKTLTELIDKLQTIYQEQKGRMAKNKEELKKLLEEPLILPIKITKEEFEKLITIQNKNLTYENIGFAWSIKNKITN